MNVLLPSVGRKYLLASMLKEALAKRGGKLIAADSSPYASGFLAADERVRLPPFDDAGFWDAALQIIRKMKIDAVIPVRDAELYGWAVKLEENDFPARVLISPSETLKTCFDKWELASLARKCGIPCPVTRLLSKGESLTTEEPLPAVVKPRRGAGSRGVFVARSAGMLTALLEESDGDVLVQEHLNGVEFTVDCYATADGELRASVVRKRIALVGGQSDVGETVYDEEVSSLCRRLAANLKFRGAINIQFIRTPRGLFLIDVNPRFAGAVAISRAAGADLAEWSIADLSGEAPHFEENYRLVTWLGYSQGVVMEKEG